MPSDPHPLNDLSQLLYASNLILGVVGIGALVGTGALLRRLSGAATRTFPAHRLLVYQWTTVILFLLYLGGGALLTAMVLRGSPALLLTLSGGAGVALGLALKDVVSSILAGITLIFDKPFQVGDRVTFRGYEGDIVDIGLRAVRLFTLSHDTVTIPNSVFLTEAVASGNYGALSMMVDHDFHIALDADVARAQELVREVVVTSRYFYLDQPVTVLITEVEVAHQLALRLRAKAYVLDTRYVMDFRTDVSIRVTQLFLEHKIARPGRAGVS